MKRVQLVLAGLAGLSVAVAVVWAAEQTSWGDVKSATELQPVAKPAGNDAIVSGAGTIKFYVHPEQTEPWENTLSFIAKYDGNGDPTGTAVLGLRNVEPVPSSLPPRKGGLPKAHMTVDCLAVEGNMAWVSAIVTHNTNPDAMAPPRRFGPGKRVFWQVKDSGEGSGAPPDRMDIYPEEWVVAAYGKVECTAKPDLFFGTEGPALSFGNIQIIHE